MKSLLQKAKQNYQKNKNEEDKKDFEYYQERKKSFESRIKDFIEDIENGKIDTHIYGDIERFIRETKEFKKTTYYHIHYSSYSLNLDKHFVKELNKYIKKHKINI